jgi:hypothetical protein
MLVRGGGGGGGGWGGGGGGEEGDSLPHLCRAGEGRSEGGGVRGDHMHGWEDEAVTSGIGNCFVTAVGSVLCCLETADGPPRLGMPVTAGNCW